MASETLLKISHDLRTPLTTIKNAADLLRLGGPERKAISEEEKKLLNMIVDNVNREKELIDRFMREIQEK
jgi:K+-sensing histidine kinase KdpD